MNIILFDGNESYIEYGNKYAELRSYIFVADEVSFIIRHINTYLRHINFDTITDDALLAVAKEVWCDDPKSLVILEKYVEMIPKIKKSKQLKHKDKQTIIFIDSFNRSVKRLKGNMAHYYYEQFKHYNTEELIPFIEENIWRMPFLDIFENENKEDEHIQYICDAILNHDNWLSLDEVLHDFYEFVNLDDEDDDSIDFISIPLLDIPLASGMTYNQIKYTRNDLQEPLKIFNKKLNELKNTLIEIPYNDENIEKIKNLCTEKLLPLAPPLQQCIDDSLYLSHLVKQNEEDMRSKLFIGVTSVAMLIDYFEQTDIIEPYVASEVRDRVERQLDLMSTKMFMYLEVNDVYKED